MFNSSTSTCLKTYASSTETGFICNTVYDNSVDYYDFLVISGVVVFFLAFIVVKNFMEI